MKKTIETVDGGYVIHTVNGVDTRSQAVYVRHLKRYTPLENGFNEELARDVLAQIAATPMLWDQGTWRRPLSKVETSMDPEIRMPAGPTRNLFREAVGRIPTPLDVQAALEKYEVEPACGTAMCFAGWVAELTGANFVADAVMIRDRVALMIAAKGGYEDWMVPTDLVLVTLEEATTIKGGVSPSFRFEPEIYALLVERGFADDTHTVVSIAEYAIGQLGLTDGDWRDLFGANNSYETLDDKVTAYVQSPTRAGDPDAVPPNVVTGCDCPMCRPYNYPDSVEPVAAEL